MIRLILWTLGVVAYLVAGVFTMRRINARSPREGDVNMAPFVVVTWPLWAVMIFFFVGWPALGRLILWRRTR
jgi:hypothetical protein